MSKDEDQVKIPGAKKLDTGALIPVTPGNKHILKRSDIVPVELVRSKNDDDSPGPWVEAAGSDSAKAVILSGSLTLIGRALRDNAQQAKNLVEAALRIDNGEEFLVQEGYLPPSEDTDQQATLDSLDEDSTVDNGSGSSEEKAAKADAKAESKRARKKREAEERNQAVAKAKEEADAKAKEEADAKAKEEADANPSNDI